MSTSRLPNRSCATVREYMAERTAGGGGRRARASKKPLVPGKLSFVDNTVDANTGTIQLKGLFDNQDQNLWPGQFVDTI